MNPNEIRAFLIPLVMDLDFEFTDTLYASHHQQVEFEARDGFWPWTAGGCELIGRARFTLDDDFDTLPKVIKFQALEYLEEEDRIREEEEDPEEADFPLDYMVSATIEMPGSVRNRTSDWLIRIQAVVDATEYRDVKSEFYVINSSKNFIIPPDFATNESFKTEIVNALEEAVGFAVDVRRLPEVK